MPALFVGHAGVVEFGEFQVQVFDTLGLLKAV